MRATIALAALLLLAVPAGAGAQGQAEPVSAQEAESVIVEARDFIANLLWEATEEYWHVGRWDECIRLCKQAIQVDPHFVEAYTSAAWMLWNLERDEEAVAIFEAGIEANPERWEIHHEFGMYYWQRQNLEPALEQFRQSVARGAPMHHQHMLPNVLERLGRSREALAEWRAILERFPDNPVARRRIEALEAEAGIPI